MVASRFRRSSRKSTWAEESVIEAPKPSIVWYVRLGSRLIVSFSEPPGRNSAALRLLNFKAPSGVVTHTCARGGAATAGPAIASARAAARISAPRRLTVAP